MNTTTLAFDRITQQLDEALTALEAVQSVVELAGVETKYLGRDKGLNELRRQIRSLPREDRPDFGARINEAVAVLRERIEEIRSLRTEQNEESIGGAK